MYTEKIIWSDQDDRKMTNETLESAINCFKKNKNLSELVSSELYKGDKLIATYDREEGYKWIAPKFTISKELAALVEEKRGKYSLAQEVEERGSNYSKFWSVNTEMWNLYDLNTEWFENRLVNTAGVYQYGNEKIGKVVDVLYHHGYAIEGEETEEMEENKVIISTDPLIKLSEPIYTKIVENKGIVTFRMFDDEKESFRELWDIHSRFIEEIDKKEDRQRGAVEAAAEWVYETFIKEEDKPEPVEFKLDPENAIKCAFCGGINVQVKRVDGDLVTFLCNTCTRAAQGKEVTFVKEAHKGL